MTMKYRKKPVVIDAIQLEDSVRCLDVLHKLGLDPVNFTYADEDPVLVIFTLEGTMIAHVGDYIIKGVNGEFYPCKPDIFEKTYEMCVDVSGIPWPWGEEALARADFGVDVGCTPCAEDASL